MYQFYDINVWISISCWPTTLYKRCFTLSMKNKSHFNPFFCWQKTGFWYSFSLKLFGNGKRLIQFLCQMRSFFLFLLQKTTMNSWCDNARRSSFQKGKKISNDIIQIIREEGKKYTLESIMVAHGTNHTYCRIDGEEKP